MEYQAYQKVTGVIQQIRNTESCCRQMVTVMSEDGEVNFIVTGDTTIIDSVRLRRGMRIAAFYDGSLPAPAIFPPQYQAELITVLRKNQEVALNYFDDTLTAEDGSLKLNLSPMTNIETINGQRFWCTPENMEILVYYTTTTFSIPPQTTPQKIIVLCPGE